MLLAVLYRWGAHSRRAALPTPAFTPEVAPKVDLSKMSIMLELNSEFTHLVAAVVPSVVSITTTSLHVPILYQNPINSIFQRFGLPTPGLPSVRGEGTITSLGSGVIVSADGYIVTNYHVIKDVDRIRVQMHDGRTFPAKLLGSDPQSDIAVLKIAAKNLSPLAFADSNAVKTGEAVIAVGNPFGLQETVTRGIISATGRRTSDNSANEYLQTDAAINPGNSGGPLVNLRGEIVGINSSILNSSSYSGTSARVNGWQGIGFAIPANVVRESLTQIIKSGHVEHAYLGMSGQPLTPELAQQFGVPKAKGILVSEVVEHSPAQRGGLVRGDIIQKFNSAVVNDPQTLYGLLAKVKIGSVVKLDIIRDGKPLTISITVAKQPGESAAASQSNALSGIHATAIPPSQLGNLPPDVQGVMISYLDYGCPAAQQLYPGDVIEQINRQPVASVEQFNRIVARLKPDDHPLLSICRGKTRLFAVILPNPFAANRQPPILQN